MQEVQYQSMAGFCEKPLLAADSLLPSVSSCISVHAHGDFSLHLLTRPPTLSD